MSRRAPAARRQRRVTAAAMGLSVAVHAAVLAFVRFGLPATPGSEAARAAPDGDRYLRERPLEVVRLARGTAASEPDGGRAGVGPEAPAARSSRGGETAARARPRLPTAALYLRPAERVGGGLERVTLAPSTVAGAEGASRDQNEGVAFEAASRAARSATRERAPAGRGRGIGIGILIAGPGVGSCDSSLPPDGGAVPTAIVDDFAGRFRGARSGEAGPAGAGSPVAAALGAARRAVSGPLPVCVEGRGSVGAGRGVRGGRRPGC